MVDTQIAGYTYGTPSVPRSPVSLDDLALLQQTVLWSEEDEQALRMAGEVLGDQVDEILDVWYGFVASHPHLVRYFSTPDGQPIDTYLGRVRERFGQWIRDTCERPYDQAWLDYQYQIALRHHSEKGKTDQADTVPVIHLRYMIAFIVPITVTIKPFLAKKGHSEADVEKMYAAWFKSITLQVALWSYPYTHGDDF